MVPYSSDMSVLKISAASLDAQMGWLFGRVIRVVAETISVRPNNTVDSEMTPMELDLEYIRQSRQGDSDAYRRLIEKHQEHVGAILWRFSRDRLVHEELVQDVFVEAYLSLKSYRAKAPFAHWLARIATRVGYRYWKQTARVQQAEPFSLEQWDRVAGSGDQQVEATEAAELMHSLMAQLPPRDRLVLTLRYLEGCDVAQTAQRTGWTKTMVKVQSLRARSKLKKLFEQNWRDNDE